MRQRRARGQGQGARMSKRCIQRNRRTTQINTKLEWLELRSRSPHRHTRGVCMEVCLFGGAHADTVIVCTCACGCACICRRLHAPNQVQKKVTKSRAPTNQPRIHHLIVTDAQSAPRPSGCITLHTTITRPAAGYKPPRIHRS